MTSCDRKFLPLTGNFVHWRERSSFNRKFLPVTGNFFLRQEISSCDRKFLPVTGNFFLLQEIYLETGNFLPWQEISTCDMKFLTQSFFQGQDISDIFHPSDIKSQQKRGISGYISKHPLRVQSFLPRFLGPWLLKSHPGPECRPRNHRDSLAATEHMGVFNLWCHMPYFKSNSNFIQFIFTAKWHIGVGPFQILNKKLWQAVKV